LFRLQLFAAAQKILRCVRARRGADVSVIRPEHVHLFGKRHSALALLIGAVILTGRTTYHLNML
jgi:hypothetical protein